jgi:Tfp pilus assembly protein PilO
MENFSNTPQGYGVEPKKKSGAIVWVLIIIVVLVAGYFLLFKGGMKEETIPTDTTALDNQIDNSINSILSDLQAEDATADSSVADFSDLYQFDINQ